MSHAMRSSTTDRYVSEIYSEILFGQDTPRGHRSFEMPGAKPHYSPDRPGHVTHIALDLQLDFDHHRCSGTCTIHLMVIRPGIQHLTLDAVDQQIHQVTLGDQPQAFNYDGQQLEIEFTQPLQAGQEAVFTITYALDRPQRGLYFIQPDDHYPHKPIQVWTQGEDEDSRYWFPCFDYPGQLATSEIQVTVPAQFQALSNGELLTVEDRGTSKRYHWFQREVHPTYLMALVVGKFVELRAEWRGKPVLYYVDPRREDDALRTMGKTPRMIEFFSERFGYPYPFPKYAQVCVDDFIFGGMENTSITVLTDKCLLDERAALDDRRSETLVAHELAHQWFGDLVVIKHWAHAWLKEGMATYAETLWINQEYGPEEAAYYQLQTLRSYLQEDSSRYRRPIVTYVYREPIELYDRHLYEKGACVYHLLRQELGEDLFWQSIRYFVQHHAHQTVETVDLLRAIETTTGRNLLYLFDQYVFRGGHPDYQVAYSWDGESNLAKVTVVQTQAQPDQEGKDCFDLKMTIAFALTPRPQELPTPHHPDWQVFSVRVHEANQTFYFPLTQKPQFLSLDPHNAIPKTLTLDYPLPLLKAQLQGDPNPVSRIEAALALAQQGGLEALNALALALREDPFWGVRVEIAEQLPQIKLDQTLEALMPGLQDRDPRVRRATVNALAQLPVAPSYQALKAIALKGDASYWVEADALASLGKFGEVLEADTDYEPEILALLTQALQDRSGWNDVVQVGAVRGLSGLKQSRAALDLILTCVQVGNSQSLRLAAIRALGTIASGQTPGDLDRILQQLNLLSRETFYLTQVAVVVALKAIDHPKALGILRDLGEQTTDARVRLVADEARARVQERLAKDASLKGLRKDLDTLRRDNQTLRSRLEDLEAKTKVAAQPDSPS